MEAEAEKGRGVERLIFFTDAVAAIAITLLILPLVEIVTTDAGKGNAITVEQFLYNNVSQILAFGLSFLIIARFWLANHEILADTIKTTTVLMWLDLAWVFTIVALPLPTEITAVYPASELTTCIYIGTCFAGTLLLTAMSAYLYRHPELEKKDKPVSTLQIWGIGSTAAAFAVAFLLAVIFPNIHYWALLVLLLATPLDFIVKPRLRVREAARRAR
ncbi:MAG TPA: TMEM175 family protein [Galbitalea sp.]|nr:TMEM175 family protein [Galbitalea sp.]